MSQPGNFIVKYTWRVFQTQRGWVALVKKRVGDLTFSWWRSRPLKSKSRARRAAKRQVVLAEFMDAHSEEYLAVWRRQVKQQPLLDRKATAEVVGPVLASLGGAS